MSSRAMQLIVVLVTAGILIIGLSTYGKYLSEKNSIEREKMEQAKTEKNREYAASQKESCLNIYKQESAKYNNVKSWRYSTENDRCYLSYKDPKPKTEAECKETYKDEKTGSVNLSFLMEYLNCTDGTFENAF